MTIADTKTCVYSNSATPTIDFARLFLLSASARLFSQRLQLAAIIAAF